MLKTILKSGDKGFLRRWPKTPKVVFFAAPNSFQDEIIQRFSIDMGLPVISLAQVMANIQQFAGKTEEFNHPFFLKVKEMLDNKDLDAQLQDKVALKLLRLTNTGREGFILTDFPRNVEEAAMLEEFRGGMNAFVHLSLPDDIQVAIEENKLSCTHCGRVYYTETIISEEQGIHIEPFAPKDGHCFDCGSKDFERNANTPSFEQVLQGYKKQKEELLGFYDHLGLLVDFEIKTGYADYAKIRDQIQFNIKH